MDSLMAVELRRRLEAGLGKPLSAGLAFDYPTIDRLARYLLADLFGVAPVHRPADEDRRSGAADGPIAVIGMGCRFPGGANDPAAFWRLLSEGRDAVRTVPADRWDVDAFYDANPDTVGKTYTRQAGFLDVPVDGFDAAFFGITPREAASMDPQQRLLLETCWEALEDAGQDAEALSGSRTGVFVGINSNDYGRLLAECDSLTRLDAYTFTGNTASVAAGRLSFLLGLQGPSVAVDTSCSSSLVAVHLACQALRRRVPGGAGRRCQPDARARGECCARPDASAGAGWPMQGVRRHRRRLRAGRRGGRRRAQAPRRRAGRRRRRARCCWRRRSTMTAPPAA